MQTAVLGVKQPFNIHRDFDLSHSTHNSARNALKLSGLWTHEVTCGCRPWSVLYIQTWEKGNGKCANGACPPWGRGPAEPERSLGQEGGGRPREIFCSKFQIFVSQIRRFFQYYMYMFSGFPCRKWTMYHRKPLPENI